MSDARLPAALEASAIRRAVEASGGDAMVLRSGDPDRGSLVLVINHRGVHHAILERMLEPGGQYRWARAGSIAANSAQVADFLVRRAQVDPDSWLIELDVPNAERFIAEMGATG
ncbi:MAG: DUF1491 family protein [Sphingomicrobium sp.]